MGLNFLKSIVIKLSDIWNTNDGRHLDGFLCSTKHLWEADGLKEDGSNGLPINFRIVNHENTYFSASGIFTAKQLENAVLQKIPEGKRIFVIDLLKEYHGFIEYSDNAIPVSFRAKHNVVNFGINYDDILTIESQIFNAMNDKYKSSISIISSFSSAEGAVGEVYQTARINNYKGFLTEEKLVQDITASKNIDILYKRLACTDHSALSYKALISFADFIQNEFNPQTDWLHIHCHGGKGRSTSLSLVFDMFTRLQQSTLHKVSFGKLLDMHKNSGGKDLNIGNTDDWKQHLADERYNFLNKIYDSLIKIQKDGLKSVFSTALHIVLLQYKGLLHTQTLDGIIQQSGEVIRNKIMSDQKIYGKLLIFYDYSLSQQAFEEENNNDMDSEYDPDDIMFQQTNDEF